MNTDKKVLVELSRSVGVGGVMYHPNSQGVSMPLKHAKAIGARIIEEDKPEIEAKETSKKEGEESPDNESETENEENSEAEKEASEDTDAEAGESGAEEDKPESENEPESQKDAQEDEGGQKLPAGFPEKERLLENGIDSVDKVLAHPDLTDFKGIGKKTAEDILKAAEELQQS